MKAKKAVNQNQDLRHELANQVYQWMSKTDYSEITTKTVKFALSITIQSMRCQQFQLLLKKQPPQKVKSNSQALHMKKLKFKSSKKN